jgi:hypothetical protein
VFSSGQSRSKPSLLLVTSNSDALGPLKDAFDSHLGRFGASPEMTHQEMPEEKQEAGLVEDQHEEFLPPNGGFEAWLLVLAGFLVFANTW